MATSLVKCLVVVVAVALLALSSCGVASAAGRGRPGPIATTRTRLKPGAKPAGKFITVRPGRFGHKRDYQAACSDEGGPACYVGCPKECPNKCLVFCSYCLSFCSTFVRRYHAHACIAIARPLHVVIVSPSCSLRG